MSKNSHESLPGEFGVRMETLDNTQGPRLKRRITEPVEALTHRTQRIKILPTRATPPARDFFDKGENL